MSLSCRSIARRLLPLTCLLAVVATGCGTSETPPDGGDMVVIGEPIEGSGNVNASWPSGDTVSVTALRMEARVACGTAAPDSPDGEICDAVVTAVDGASRVFSLSFPSVASASGRTLSLNDPSLVRVELVRDDGESASNTPGTPTVGTLVVSKLTITPELSLEAEFSSDSHLTGGSPQSGLIDVTLAGSLSLP